MIIDKLTTEERVKLIISENLIVDEELVTPGANLKEDLGADSLDGVELVMCLEEAFDIAIADDEAEKIKMVRDAVQLVEKKVRG